MNGRKFTLTFCGSSGLVTQRSRMQLPRVSVLTSLSFGITEPLQSFSSGYLRLKDRYKLDCPFFCYQNALNLRLFYDLFA